MTPSPHGPKTMKRIGVNYHPFYTRKIYMTSGNCFDDISWSMK
jgi:hypothetical protein